MCFVYLFVWDLFILFYVCECFTRMYACAQYAGLSPRRSEEVVGSPQTGVKDDCDPSSPPCGVYLYVWFCSGAQPVLQFSILLTQPLECWYCRWVPPDGSCLCYHPVPSVVGTEPRARHRQASTLSLSSTLSPGFVLAGAPVTDPVSTALETGEKQTFRP